MNWKKYMGELNQKNIFWRKMEQRIIVMGDMNCKIGDLIDGKKEEISKGGKIMIKMIKENNMIMLNSLENVKENGQEVVEWKSQ